SANVTLFRKFAVPAGVSTAVFSSVNPSSGPVGRLVTISGSGFSLTPTLNTDLFSSGSLSVLMTPALPSRSTSLTAMAASGAVTGKVCVQVGSVQPNNIVRCTVTATNQPPVVSAGANQTIHLTSEASLSRTAITDDGLPTGTLTATWSV